MSRLIDSRIRPDGAGELRLTRSDKRNALSHELVDEALAVMDEWAAAGVGVAVLAADPPVFCAGNDLVEARADRDNPAADRFLGALLERPLFWIAALSDPVLGAGVSVAAVCPIVVAEERAWLALPEREIGLYPAGVVPYIEDQLGPRLTLALGLSGERLGAAAAVEHGLYTEVAAPGQLDARIEHWCTVAGSRPQVTDAARRSWQQHFVTSAAKERGDQLQHILDSQSFAPEEETT
jgi:enoyl-CoA hydratase/carnithine racemase